MSKQKKNLKYIALITFILVTFIFVFVKIANVVSKNEVIAFDHEVIQFVQSFLSPQLTFYINFITFLGSVGWIAVIIVILVFILIVRKKVVLACFLAVSSGTGGLFNLLLKWIFKRERPDMLRLTDVDGFSFPSGHSMGSFILYGSLAYLCIHLFKRAALKWLSVIVMGIIIFLIGLSRIYLGVHYPTDVVAGFAAGAVWLTVMIVLFRYYEYKRNL